MKTTHPVSAVAVEAAVEAATAATVTAAVGALLAERNVMALGRMAKTGTVA